jgi:hypothetical protein
MDIQIWSNLQGLVIKSNREADQGLITESRQKVPVSTTKSSIPSQLQEVLSHISIDPTIKADKFIQQHL